MINNKPTNTDVVTGNNKLSVFSKLKKLPRKTLILLIIITGLIIILLIGLYLWLQPTKSNKKFEAENSAIFESMKSSQIVGGISPARTAEINLSISQEKYADAKGQVEKILSEPNVSDGDKSALYVQLSQTCIPLSDFTCIDKVVEQYDKLLNFDLYYLIEAGKLAQTKNQAGKSKEYYKKALNKIDSLGGKNFIDKANSQAQITLNYDEIKTEANK